MTSAASPWTLPPASATRPHVLASGHVVQIWAAGEVHLPGWYEPAARGGHDVEQLRFLGRVERGLAPALWLYAHRRDCEELLVDVDGAPHIATDDRRRRAGYRFERTGAAAESGDREAVVLPFRPRTDRSERPE